MGPNLFALIVDGIPIPSGCVTGSKVRDGIDVEVDIYRPKSIIAVPHFLQRTAWHGMMAASVFGVLLMRLGKSRCDGLCSAKRVLRFSSLWDFPT